MVEVLLVKLKHLDKVIIDFYADQAVLYKSPRQVSRDLCVILIGQCLLLSKKDRDNAHRWLLHGAVSNAHELENSFAEME